MTSTATRPRQARPPERDYRWLLYCTIVLLSFGLVIETVSLTTSSGSNQDPVRVERTVHGVISLLNESGNAGCVRPEQGEQACGVFYAARPLHQGERVSVAVMHVEDAQGHGTSGVLLVYESG